MHYETIVSISSFYVFIVGEKPLIRVLYDGNNAEGHNRKSGSLDREIPIFCVGRRLNRQDQNSSLWHF